MGGDGAAAPPILVTGATGNVGRPLVRALLAGGHAVRALATDPARAAAVLGAEGGERLSVARLSFARLSFARLDFGDPATFAAAFGGAEALFLMRPPAIGDAAVVVRALEAARAGGVRRVAFLSVQGAERNPVVPHHAIERHLLRAAADDGAFAPTLLRPAFFMQNLSTTHAADVRERGELFVPAGDGRTAFVDARDVGAAAARVLGARGAEAAAHAGRGYTLTGREALTYDEVAEILTRVLGRRIVYARPGALRFYRAMRRRGHPRGFAAVMVALYTTARLGLAGELSPELEQLLGRAPTGLATFARDHAAAWQ